MAMVRHRAAVAPDTRALLVYSARSWDELIFRDELLEREAGESNFALAITTTRGQRERPAHFHPRPDRALLRGILARSGQAPRHGYVCGSERFFRSPARR